MQTPFSWSLNHLGGIITPDGTVLVFIFPSIFQAGFVFILQALLCWEKCCSDSLKVRYSSFQAIAAQEEPR